MKNQRYFLFTFAAARPLWTKIAIEIEINVYDCVYAVRYGW